ncbi:hypothetical protein B0A52_07514 [Exophiala mesophila]|uniref:Uncharacterized protein n=1 Tax=Exophiala mesophila TaxID=212818 RepID=A0A438MZN1_EXOME|nr:hypothetical protein B0A52_07514 [Exophiala mesophila]
MESLQSSVCRTCRLRLQSSSAAARLFSTTSSRSYIPPESPHYVDIPEPYQSITERRPHLKGILPVPREIFPRNRPDKPGRQYLANVTRDPLEKNKIPLNEQTEGQKYKLRMAELRKSHLREGLTQLYQRKKSSEGKILRRVIYKQAEHARLIAQPEREDERLTKASLPSAMRPQKLQQISEEEEAAIFRARKERHEALLQAKVDDRKNRLHTLYMNARKFITTKEQLNTALDEAFSTGSMPIWELGMPSGLDDLLRAGDNSALQPDSMDAIAGPDQRSLYDKRRREKFDLDQTRMRRIAEKLSGGKM